MSDPQPKLLEEGAPGTPVVSYTWGLTADSQPFLFTAAVCCSHSHPSWLFLTEALEHKWQRDDETRKQGLWRSPSLGSYMLLQTGLVCVGRRWQTACGVTVNKELVQSAWRCFKQFQKIIIYQQHSTQHRQLVVKSTTKQLFVWHKNRNKRSKTCQ